MRKSVKIAVGVVGAVVLVVLGIFAAAVVSVVRDNLPNDSPRVVETDDYRFDAPDPWVTACADRAPGCLAVLASNYQWNDREYWIDTEQVAEDVDYGAFLQTALAAAGPIVEADGGKPEYPSVAQQTPFAFEGTQLLDFTHSTGARFSRSRFVRLPYGRVLRFTCFGEHSGNARDHDAMCTAALDNLHFPAAAAAAEEQARAADEQARAAAERAREDREIAACAGQNPDACDPAELPAPAASDTNSFFTIENARRLFEEKDKYAEKLQKQLDQQRASQSQPQK